MLICSADAGGVADADLSNADADASGEAADADFLQVAADGSPYFWAGGRLSSDKRTLSWENGRSEGIRKGQVKLSRNYDDDDNENDDGDDDGDDDFYDDVQHPWSFTGSRGAQPDGGRGSENCLAILNNFYNVSETKSFIKKIEVNAILCTNCNL